MQCLICKIKPKTKFTFPYNNLIEFVAEFSPQTTPTKIISGSADKIVCLFAAKPPYETVVKNVHRSR